MDGEEAHTITRYFTDISFNLHCNDWGEYHYPDFFQGSWNPESTNVSPKTTNLVDVSRSLHTELLITSPEPCFLPPQRLQRDFLRAAPEKKNSSCSHILGRMFAQSLISVIPFPRLSGSQMLSPPALLSIEPFICCQCPFLAACPALSSLLSWSLCWAHSRHQSWVAPACLPQDHTGL